MLLSLILLFVYNFAFDGSIGIESKGLSFNKNDLFSTQNSDEAESGKISSLVNDEIDSIFLDRDNQKIIYYSKTDGQFWQFDLEKKKKSNFSQKSFQNVSKINWSNDGKGVVVERVDNGQKVFSLYEFETGFENEFRQGMDEIVWDYLGDKIIYKYFNQDDGKRSINVAGKDGGNWKKITDVDFRDISIEPIPKTSLISFWNQGVFAEETSLSISSLNGGQLRQIFSGKFGADYKWSPDGKKVFVSYLKDSQKDLLAGGVIDIDGNFVALDLPTLASKIVWSLDNKHIFYALPVIPDGFVLPDDYKNGNFQTADSFWKINIETGEKKRLVELEDIGGVYDAKNLTLSPNEDSLFFINRIDNKLYSFEL